MVMRLRRNAVINIAGNVVPMFAAVIAMPLLLHGLGAPRMGLFTLALGLFGFAGIFDLGLGRALTREIAFHMRAGESPERIAVLFRAGILAVFVLGVLWGAAISASHEWLLAKVPNLDAGLRHEADAALLLIGALVPIALVSTSFVGALEGMQEFGRSNMIRTPLGVATYLVPAAVACWHPDLTAVVASLAVVRVLGLVVFVFVVARRLPLLIRGGGNQLPTAPMWRYTGWLTVSNIVGPVMVYGDRYYLATLLPPAGVGQYTVPMDTMFRATSLPSAALNAIFPALTNAHAEPQTAKRFFDEVAAIFGLAWLAPLVVASILLPEALKLWLGEAYAQPMMETSHLILAGVLVNGFALVPFTLLQAIGRTDLTAKLHLVELPLFVLALTLLVPHFGAVGAATAWCMRVSLDTMLLLAMASHCFPEARRSLIRLGLLALLGLVIVLTGMLLRAPSIRFGIAASIVLLSLIVLHHLGGVKRMTALIRAAIKRNASA